MNEIICEVCGKPFTVKFQREWRPFKYCSPNCREIKHREVMLTYQRKQRAKLYNAIQLIHREAHIEIGLYKTSIPDYRANPRVNDTHDSWDYIPRLKDYHKLGTQLGTNLSIVKDESGQERVGGILQIEKAKKKE